MAKNKLLNKWHDSEKDEGEECDSSDSLLMEVLPKALAPKLSHVPQKRLLMCRQYKKKKRVSWERSRECRGLEKEKHMMPSGDCLPRVCWATGWGQVIGFEKWMLMLVITRLFPESPFSLVAHSLTGSSSSFGGGHSFSHYRVHSAGPSLWVFSM